MCWKKLLLNLLFLNAAFPLPTWAADAPGCAPGSESSPMSVQLKNLIASTTEVLKFYGPGAGDPACFKDPSDPYDPAYKIDFGDYEGQCIDSSIVRPPVVVDQDDRQITIANFYHNGKYWLATIPKDAVSSVLFQGVPFGSYLFGLIETKHGQLRFKLNQPILLREQAGRKTEVASLDDLIVSATATRPAGVEYSIFEGGNFGIATRVMSSTARAVEEISEDQSRIHQYELSMDSGKKGEFLVNAIVDGAKSGYQELYQLLDRNCTTVLFDSLDRTILRPEGVEPFRGHWWQFRDVIERPALQALRDRHIGVTAVPDMNEEISCAKPGEMLGGRLVDRASLGAASALCEYNSVGPAKPN